MTLMDRSRGNFRLYARELELRGEYECFEYAFHDVFRDRANEDSIQMDICIFILSDARVESLYSYNNENLTNRGLAVLVLSCPFWKSLHRASPPARVSRRQGMSILWHSDRIFAEKS